MVIKNMLNAETKANNSNRLAKFQQQCMPNHAVIL